MQYLSAALKTTEWSPFVFQGNSFNITVIQVYAKHRCWRSWSVLLRPRRLTRTNTPPQKKDVLLITGKWNAKAGNQDIPGGTGKFGLGVQNEAGQRLTEFCQENTLVIANTLFQQHKTTLHMGIIKMRFITYFLAKDGEAVHSEQKQDPELTVIQVISSS